MSIIVALSGGKASAWCAKYAIEEYPKEDVIFYFNDTKWEHEDLYRFLNDLSKKLNHPITEDSDGGSPEQLFRDLRFLGNNRTPICSKHLKAKRLQNFFKDGDTLIFGIGADEERRVNRIISVYQVLAAKLNKFPSLYFPLYEHNVSNLEVDKTIEEMSIDPPILYSLGFTHNNCSGGCVRAGRPQWKRLLETLPEVYADRERVEQEIRTYLGKDIYYMNRGAETLKMFREKLYSQQSLFEEEENAAPMECVGICDSEN